MRKFFSLCLLTASAALAQNAQVGIGVGLEKSIIQFRGNGDGAFLSVQSIVPVNFTTMSLPILINGMVKLEPEIGYSRFSTTTTIAGEDQDYSSSVLQAGLSLSGGRRADNLLYEFGVKAGLARQASSSESPDGKTGMTQNNLFIGPILGVEYFFLPKLSLGAQVGFSFIYVGQPDITDSTAPTTTQEDISEYVLGNNAKIDLRWYY